MKKFLKLTLTAFIVGIIAIMQVPLQAFAVSANEVLETNTEVKDAEEELITEKEDEEEDKEFYTVEDNGSEITEVEETSPELMASKESYTPRKYVVSGFEAVDDMITDGDAVYFYSSAKREMVSLEKPYSSINFKNVDFLMSMSNNELKELFGKGVSSITEKTNIDTSNFVYLDEKIYTIFTVKIGSELKRVLGAYHLASSQERDDWHLWTKVSDLPNKYNLSMSTLTYYNGELYLIGGYDEKTKTISKEVYALNMNSNKWSKKANLPEGRFGANATQVGDKLLVSFGGKENGKVPNILIYDGKKWKKSSATISINEEAKTYKSKKYYKVNTGLTADGLIFSGIETEKYGNVFNYDLKKDSYKNNKYNLEKGMKHFGISINDKYYAFRQVKNKDKSIDMVVYEIPINTGYCKVSVDYPIGVMNFYSNTMSEWEKTFNSWEMADGKDIEEYEENPNSIFKDELYYMPGQIMELSIDPNRGYYTKSFKVDGKEISSNEYKDIILSQRKVSVRCEKVSQAIKLNTTHARMSAFDTLQLKATVKDKSITNLKWITWNKDIIKVSSKGKVTPKYTYENTCASVIVEGTRKDGRIIEAECVIDIILPKLNNLEVTEVTTSTISYKWSKVKNCDGYKVIIYDTKNGSEYNGFKEFKTNKNSIKIQKLEAGTRYTVKVCAYKNIDNKECDADSSRIVSATKTEAPKLNKVSSSNKILKAEWGKPKGAEGYQVYCSSSKNGKYSKVATIKKGKTTSAKIKGLKKGKKYFVTVRAYKSVDGKKIYSEFSNIKSTTIK